MLARSPVIWGSAAAAIVLAPFALGMIDSQFLCRYIAGHPIQYTETAAFVGGVAVLAAKGLVVAQERRCLSAALLGPRPAHPQPIESCHEMLSRLASSTITAQDCLFGRRLREGLRHVLHRGSADKLDEHLQTLADVDAAAAHSSYALVRAIIWGIPILGFLGTVVGITIALANLSPKALEESLPHVTAGLGVAFDTTALALALSMALVFVQLIVDGFEQRMLAAVQSTAADELLGRFEHASAPVDSSQAHVRRMAEAVIAATERIVQRQAELWRATIDEARERWSSLATVAREQTEAALSTALAHGTQQLAAQVAIAAQATAEVNHKHWSQVQRALGEQVDAARGQQTELVRQGEVLLRVLEATGQIARLEECLNRNLAALSGTRNLEETLVSLSAAANLLTARLAGGHATAASVELRPRRAPERAA